MGLVVCFAVNSRYFSELFDLFNVFKRHHSLLAEQNVDTFMRMVEQVFVSLAHAGSCEETQAPTSVGTSNSYIWQREKRKETSKRQEEQRLVDNEAMENEKADRTLVDKIASAVIPLSEKSPILDKQKLLLLKRGRELDVATPTKAGKTESGQTAGSQARKEEGNIFCDS